MTEKDKIKIIEDLSLNAWPSHQIQIYDGWLLRFSHFYTHRTNCVEQLGPSSIPLPDKLDYCEEIYRAWGTPAIYKISPLISGAFDQKLMERGYCVSHVTEVMSMELKKKYSISPENSVNTSHLISFPWLEALFSMKGTVSQIHKRIVPSMYSAIPKETIAAWVYKENQIVGTGLGILDRDYVGLYAIHVREDCRSRGLGRSICQTILNAAIEKGASSAYLQVVKGNFAAKKLYASLGFQDFYTYWFRQEYPVPGKD